MPEKRKLRVTLVRSLIGEKPKIRATARGLGLSRVRSTVEHQDLPGIRGMIERIAHLVDVEEA